MKFKIAEAYLEGSSDNIVTIKTDNIEEYKKGFEKETGKKLKSSKTGSFHNISLIKKNK